MSNTPLVDMLARMIRHQRFMDNAHATWEMLYGTPCGPYDPRRAGRPKGIALILRDGDDPRFP